MTTGDQKLREQTLALMGQYQSLLTEQRFDEWIELWAADGICEFPYAPGDRPRRLCGYREYWNPIVAAEAFAWPESSSS